MLARGGREADRSGRAADARRRELHHDAVGLTGPCIAVPLVPAGNVAEETQHRVFRHAHRRAVARHVVRDVQSAVAVNDGDGVRTVGGNRLIEHAVLAVKPRPAARVVGRGVHPVLDELRGRIGRRADRVGSVVVPLVGADRNHGLVQPPLDERRIGRRRGARDVDVRLVEGPDRITAHVAAPAFHRRVDHDAADRADALRHAPSRAAPAAVHVHEHVDRVVVPVVEQIGRAVLGLLGLRAAGEREVRIAGIADGVVLADIGIGALLDGELQPRKRAVGVDVVVGERRDGPRLGLQGGGFSRLFDVPGLQAAQRVAHRVAFARKGHAVEQNLHLLPAQADVVGRGGELQAEAVAAVQALHVVRTVVLVGGDAVGTRIEVLIHVRVPGVADDAAQQVVDMVLVAGVGFVLGREERPQIGGRHFARLGRHPLRDVRRG